MRNNVTLRIGLELLKLNSRCGYSLIEEQWVDVHCIGCKYVNWNWLRTWSSCRVREHSNKPSCFIKGNFLTSWIIINSKGR